MDPMGAVPDLPFGHLNATWLKFKVSLEPADSIWSFSVEWCGNWGRREIRAGYVAVRDTGFGPNFLTKWRRLDKD